jgi:hypothetical protein
MTRRRDWAIWGGAALVTASFLGVGVWSQEHPHDPRDWVRDACHDEIRAQIPGGADFSAEKVAHSAGITYVATGTYRTRGPYPLSYPYACTANATAGRVHRRPGIDGLGR